MIHSFIPLDEDDGEVNAPLDFSRLNELAVSPQPRPISVAWLVVPCVACDFLMVPVFSSLRGPPGEAEAVFALAFGIVGCVLAQGNLLAAFLAWGDGPFLRRFARHWVIAVILYLVWLLGLVLAVGGRPFMPNFAKTVALGVPLLSIAAQFPLWLARQCFGWRLVKVNVGSAGISEPPLTIRDLMMATLVAAATLALARLATPADGKPVWPIWAVTSTAACLISSVALLPAGALLLRPRIFTDGLAWGVLYATSFIALLWIVVAAIWWFVPQALAPRAIYVGLSSLMFTFAITLLLTAAIAHSRGYRLAWGRR